MIEPFFLVPSQETLDGFLAPPELQTLSLVLRQEAPQYENTRPYYSEITEERTVNCHDGTFLLVRA